MTMEIIPPPNEPASYASRTDIEPPGSNLWWSVLAVIFLGGGIALLIFGRDSIVVGIGVFFLSISLIQVDTAIRVFRFHAQKKRLSRQFNDAGWASDYPWDPTGQADGRLGPTVRSVCAGLWWCAMCLASGLFVTQSNAPFAFVYFALAVLIGLLFLYFLAVKKILHHLKFGTSRLRFSRMPYKLGEKFEAELVPGKPLQYQKLRLTLRCLQPYTQPSGPRSQSGQQYLTVFYQPYVAQVEENRKGEWYPSQAPIRVCFIIPKLPLATNLSGSQPVLPPGIPDLPLPDGLRYWELEVRAIQPGTDYVASFLLPIYA